MSALTILGTPFPVRQFFGNDGAPLAGGLIEFFVAGSEDHLDTWSDAAMGSLNTNPVELDAYGRAQIFTDPTKTYDYTVSTSAGVELDAVEGYQDPAGVIYGMFGQVLATGSRNVASGYQVLITETFVTIAANTVNPTIVYLDDARLRTKPLCLKNFGIYPVTVTAQGGQTIDLAATYTMPAASAPGYPALFLLPDPTVAGGAFLIAGSHKTP